jgi:hypothetical protein
MYGVFAVRVIEDDSSGGGEPGSAQAVRPPPGHTDYSWAAPADSSRIPAGHTAFSWNAGRTRIVYSQPLCRSDPAAVPLARAISLPLCGAAAAGGAASATGGSDRARGTGGSGQAPRREAWGDATDPALVGARQLDVYCGNPMVQTVRARVHLYTRRYDLAGGGGGTPPPPTPTSSIQASDAGTPGGSSDAVAAASSGSGEPLQQQEEQQQQQQQEQQQHYQLFVLAVPSYLSPADFCSFIGPGLMENVLHMRVVRDDDPSRYMVLLQMRDHNAAEELRQMKNGAQFSSLLAGAASSSSGGGGAGGSEEAETCYVLYIQQLIWEHQQDGSGSGGIDGRGGPSCDGETAIALAMNAMAVTTDPNSSSGGGGGGGGRHGSTGSGRVSPTAVLGQAKALAPPPPPGHVEVPRCPVCLERLDPHASGILTVLCNHSFHSDCLTKWGDSTCPVCR